MATIDRVYQTVQNMINKEQRGYLTPEEFNSFANLAQNEIFELYFHDYNFFENARKAGRTNTEYADLPMHFRERINMFSTTASVTTISADTSAHVVPDNLYRLISVEYNGAYVEEEEFDQLRYSERTRLGRSSTTRPVYTRLGNNIRVYPSITDGITINYIRRPMVPQWTYTLVAGSGNPLFNESSSTFQDFEIHPADEHELTKMILGYTGVSIKESDVAQFAQNEEAGDQQYQFRV